MEFFNRNQTIISFVMFFWTTPKEGLSENEKAARNVARMEASMVGGSSSSSSVSKPKNSPIMKAYKDIQAKQMRYALMITMMLGMGFLGYSFVTKKET